MPLVKAGMTTYGHTVTVRQSYQPTMQGAETGASLYFFKVADKRIGQPNRKSVWNAGLSKFIDTDLQRMEITFQINALVKQVATTTTTQPTASDYLNTAAMLMQSSNFVNALKEAGIAILNIGEIRNPYFKNEKDQFEASPSFDFTLVYNRVLVRDGLAVEVINLNVNRV